MRWLWKETLIIVSFLVIFALPTFAAESCTAAVPRYGVIQCINSGQRESQTLQFVNTNEQTTSNNFACLSNCEVQENDILFTCDNLQALHWELYLDGSATPLIVKSANPMENKGNLPYSFERPHSVILKAWCRGLDAWTTHPTKTAAVSIKQDLIILKEGWAGSLPDVTITGSEGCTLNKVVDIYKGEAIVTSYLNPVTDTQTTKPTSTYSNVNEMPTNWKINDNYIFVKDWQTGIADISFTYNKQNNVYWCGGLSGSRKIYNVNKITSTTGACYAVPTSVYLQNIECCFPADCSWKGSTYTCNPDTWKCEETKPCNSELDCQQTFTSGVCQSKQVTNWVCDTSKKWGNNAGTCVKQTKTVQQCSSDCTSNEYYNDVEGVCKPRVIILDCPPGRCCKSGGNYKEQTCMSSLECCTTSDLIIGECKQSCAPPPSNPATTSEQGQTGNELSGGQTITDTSIASPLESGSMLILIVIIVIVAAGGLGYYFMKQKPSKTSKGSQAHCTKCGAKIKDGIKFCNKCGKKL